MKKYISIITFIVAQTLGISNVFAQDKIDNASDNKYIIEKNHASVMWNVNHLGFSNVSGKFTNLDGYIIFDEKNLNNSKVEVEINTKDIATGLPKFEDHLRSEDFLNVKKYPKAKFVSKKIVKKTQNTAEIYGDLTLLDVTKEVVLKVKFNKSAPNPMNKKPTIGFSATTAIKRSDFNMSYAIPNVADKVDLIIEVEANK
jgi:polyisoprenoid-binding protein YceI